MKSYSFYFACTVLLMSIVLLPGTARVQEQKPVFQTPEPPDAAEGPDRAQGGLIMPAGQGTMPDSEQELTPAAEADSPEKPATAKTKAGDSRYIIKQGDTLWDISNGFYRDPFLWPLIWKANSSINNPDLIYPGARLTIPSLAPIERAIQKPTEKTAPVEQAHDEGAATPQPFGKPKPRPTTVPEEETPSMPKLVLPEEAAVPIIDKYAMLSAGFLSEEETDDKIVGSLEPKSIYAYDDVVYITISSQETVNVGDKFLIYSVLNKVKHPKTGDSYGRLVKGLGVLQVIAKDTPDVLTARITLSFDAIQKGHFLTPYQEPSLIYEPSLQRKKDVSGYILEVIDGRTINAQTDIVYLDKGSADGIEPGDRLTVYIEPEETAIPRKKVGELQVFLVKDNSSTAVVRKSVDTLAKGDAIEYKK